MRVPSRLLRPDEFALLHCREHGHVVILPIATAMFFAAIAGAVIAAFEQQHVGWILAAALLAWFVISGPRLLRWWTTKFLVTTQRLMVRRGWRGSNSVITEWSDVDDVWVDQSWLQRRGGWGTVHVDLHDGDLHDGHPQGVELDDLRDGTPHSGDEDLPPPTMALTGISNPEDFRSRCVIAMELTDLVSDGAGHQACLALLDDLVERGHLHPDELNGMRATVRTFVAD